MRTLLKIEIPVEAGNAAVKDGSIAKTIGSMMESLKPEASYFYTANGRRAMLIVFDLKNPSDIPGIAEPLFAGFNAAVEMYPVMNADDLGAGLGNLS